MVIDMNEEQLNTVAQVRAFLNGTQEVRFEPKGEDPERYAFIAAVVKRLDYDRLPRPDKGVVMRYLARTTGYSRQQVTRLVRRARAGEALVKRYKAPTPGFARRFTAVEVALLAETDALHGTLSGPATKCLMQRAVAVFQDTRYARLATISVAHLYRLRHARGYEMKRRHWTKTRGHGLPIAERRAPAPENRPGFIRIDSVHQGDLDGVKGVYHVNAVDCVTQFEMVASCERISEVYLLPVIETLLASFPFEILGFHADNVLTAKSSADVHAKASEAVLDVLDTLYALLSKDARGLPQSKRSPDLIIVNTRSGERPRSCLKQHEVPWKARTLSTGS